MSTATRRDQHVDNHVEYAGARYLPSWERMPLGGGSSDARAALPWDSSPSLSGSTQDCASGFLQVVGRVCALTGTLRHVPTS